MIYVPEILNARLEDNLIEAKKMRAFNQELCERLKQETDKKAIFGIEMMIKDSLFEYETLSNECKEIRLALKLIGDLQAKKDKKKKRAHSSLATGRLNSYTKFKSHASL